MDMSQRKHNQKPDSLGPHVCLFQFMCSIHELLPNGEINPSKTKAETVAFKITEKDKTDAKETFEEFIESFKEWLKTKRNNT